MVSPINLSLQLQDIDQPSSFQNNLILTELACSELSIVAFILCLPSISPIFESWLCCLYGKDAVTINVISLFPGYTRLFKFVASEFLACDLTFNLILTTSEIIYFKK